METATTKEVRAAFKKANCNRLEVIQSYTDCLQGKMRYSGERYVTYIVSSNVPGEDTAVVAARVAKDMQQRLHAQHREAQLRVTGDHFGYVYIRANAILA